MLILGIDPATRCGWAILDEEGERIDSGTWQLCNHADHAERLDSMRDALQLLAAQYDRQIVAVAYEETNRHRSRAQARVGYGLEAVILLAAARHDWMALTYTAQQIKAAAGDAKADKAAMVAAARQQWGVTCDWHDEADALWTAEVARRDIIKAQMRPRRVRGAA